MTATVDLPFTTCDRCEARRGTPLRAPCPATLPYAGGVLNRYAGVEVTHGCALAAGHTEPHHCEDCSEEWT
jgi:hypothetical protein